MKALTLLGISTVWLLDFEFCAQRGERPNPICLVAREFLTGQLRRVWLYDDESLKGADNSPFDTGPRSLFVSYNSSAEWGCFLAMKWPMPIHVLDLYAEFRNFTNGQRTICGNGLLGALAHFGLPAMNVAEKDEFRQLAMRGGPYSEAEQVGLLDYCQTDVDALVTLLPRMLPHIDLPRALVRGRYMTGVAGMEHRGVPIDVCQLTRLKQHWGEIQSKLVHRVNQEYDVYEPRDRRPNSPSSELGQAVMPMRFSAERWARFLAENRIPWPRLPSGALALDDETFRQMSRRFPQTIAPIRELRHTLGQLRLNDLTVGADGRNRCLLSPFQSTTGRNQPSTSRFIFGLSRWLRGLIKPPDGRALAYVDWSQQEFGIAGKLSGDQKMMDAYMSGDPYLTFAKQAGAVPQDATKQSHPMEREQFKECALAVQYGMGERSLSQKLGVPPIIARELLHLHQQTYQSFWKWSQAAVDHALLHGWLQTVFGWRIHVASEANWRSLANFPCQANGAEMLRLACCFIDERGIELLAPIHDAVLIEASIENIEEAVAQTKDAMREASAVVLDGFELRTDAEIIRWPDRYMDVRGEKMWNTVMSSLDEIDE